jgi:hypothetical protein
MSIDVLITREKVMQYGHGVHCMVLQFVADVHKLKQKPRTNYF